MDYETRFKSNEGKHLLILCQIMGMGCLWYPKCKIFQIASSVSVERETPGDQKGGKDDEKIRTEDDLGEKLVNIIDA
jgi:hypothetical protein